MINQLGFELRWLPKTNQKSNYLDYQIAILEEPIAHGIQIICLKKSKLHFKDLPWLINIDVLNCGSL